MAQLKFDQTGERFYETGVSKGVLYVWDNSLTTPAYAKGVAWNGLTSVSESPEGAEPTDLYADNIKYLTLMSNEEFNATIECYTYPDAFGKCDGSVILGTKGTGAFHIGQQKRSKFCLVYQTKIGNDEDPDAGVKLHIIYNCLASPSEKAYETVNDSPDAITFSYEVSTTPLTEDEMLINNVQYKPTSHIEICSTDFADGVEDTKWINIINKLYGTDGVSPAAGTEPTIQFPSDLYDIITAE